MDAELRWCWLFRPFRGTSGRISPRRTLAEVMQASGIDPPTITFPRQESIIAGQTIEQATRFTKPPRVYGFYTGEPLEAERHFTRKLMLYAPTDRELCLMESWGYDRHNPDWKRFGDELAQQSLIAGRVLPVNWRSKSEFTNFTATQLVDWMNSLRSSPSDERNREQREAEAGGQGGKTSDGAKQLKRKSRKTVRASVLVEQAVRSHHKFEGGIVDQTIPPISGRVLAKQSGKAFSARSADRWFVDRFGSKEAYQSACINGTLGRMLTVKADDARRAFGTFDQSENEVSDDQDDDDEREQCSAKAKRGKKPPAIVRRY